MKDTGHTDTCISELSPYEFSVKDKNKGGLLNIIVYSHKLSEEEEASHIESGGWVHT